MTAACHVELTTLRRRIQNANITADAKHSILWCLDQLPMLYADFCRTNEKPIWGHYSPVGHCSPE